MRARGFLIACLLAACEEEVCEECVFEPRWREGPSMPGRRLEAGVGTLGTRLVVAGGIATSLQEGITITNEVLVLDTLSPDGEWQRLPDAPVAWTHAAVAGVGTTLYLLGGLEGTSFTPRGEAFALDLGAPEWRPLAPMPEHLVRGAAGLVVSPPHIFLIGGASANASVASVLDYDLSTNTWSQLPDLPIARSHPAAMRDADGTLVVAGGLGDLGSSRPLGDVWALAPGATEWVPREPMPTNRGGCAYGVAYGQLVCAGGEAGLDALVTVESYDIDLNTWTRGADLPVPRAGVQGAVVGQQLYVPGGAARLEFEPTDTVLVFGLGQVVYRDHPL